MAYGDEPLCIRAEPCIKQGFLCHRWRYFFSSRSIPDPRMHKIFTAIAICGLAARTCDYRFSIGTESPESGVLAMSHAGQELSGTSIKQASYAVKTHRQNFFPVRAETGERKPT